MRRFRKLKIVLLLLLWAGSAHAAEVTVAWDSSAAPNVAGYRLYWGISSRIYSANVDVGLVQSHTIRGLSRGMTYYFAVTAYNEQGLESDFSNEIAYTFTLDSDGDGPSDGFEYENGWGQNNPFSGDGSGPDQDTSPTELLEGEVLVLYEPFDRSLRICRFSCEGEHWRMLGIPTWDALSIQGNRYLWNLGSTGSGLISGSYYEQLDSWAIYGPFDLSDTAGGEIAFDYLFEKEAVYSQSGNDGDRFGYYLSIDGVNFFGWYYPAGSSQGWQTAVRSFNEWGPLGDISGESQVWIGFRFQSDSSGSNGLGAVIDNVRIKKNLSSSSARPALIIPWIFTSEKTMNYIVLNNNAPKAFRGSLVFKSPKGSNRRFPVYKRDRFSVPCNIPPGGFIRLVINHSEISREGYAVLLSNDNDPNISGNLFYRARSGRFSSPALPPSHRYQVFVADRFWDSSIILVNPGNQENRIHALLKNNNGETISQTLVQLSPGAQFRRDFKDFFPLVDSSIHSGIIQLIGKYDFSASGFFHFLDGSIEIISGQPGPLEGGSATPAADGEGENEPGPLSVVPDKARLNLN